MIFQQWHHVYCVTSQLGGVRRQRVQGHPVDRRKPGMNKSKWRRGKWRQTKKLSHSKKKKKNQVFSLNTWQSVKVNILCLHVNTTRVMAALMLILFLSMANRICTCTHTHTHTQAHNWSLVMCQANKTNPSTSDIKPKDGGMKRRTKTGQRPKIKMREGKGRFFFFFYTRLKESHWPNTAGVFQTLSHLSIFINSLCRLQCI